MKKLPPYGKGFVVPETRIVMLYAGGPQCWSAAAEDRSAGIMNHLVLPQILDADQYRWPVNDTIITVINFNPVPLPKLYILVNALIDAGAREVGIRQMPEETVFYYRKKSQERAA